MDMTRPEDTIAIVRDGARLEGAIVPWDSEIFGFPVAQLSQVELADDALADGILGELDAWCADRDVRLVSCRLDHRKLSESMALEHHGFRFVEVVYGPRLEPLDGIAAPRHAIEVTEATPEDLGPIQDIAHAAFTTGRFLLDPRLDPELSRRRYAAWVRNSMGSTAQVVLKAEVHDDLIGFFIVEARPDGTTYWHLTAIASAWQGQGLGLSLWQTMLLRHRREGATAVETTISGHNIPVLNLYARLGFSIASSQMTFHWLR